MSSPGQSGLALVGAAVSRRHQPDEDDMTKLSNAQREQLTAAASAETGIEADTHSKAAIAGLIKRGLLILLPRGHLMITEKGRRAVAPEPEPTASDQEGASPAAPTPEPRTTKIGTLVKLLCRREGATIAQMMEAAGGRRTPCAAPCPGR